MKDRVCYYKKIETSSAAVSTESASAQSGLLFTVLVTLVAATGVSLFESLDWRLQLIAHWRPHLAASLVIFGAVSILLKRRRIAIAAFGVATVNVLLTLGAARYLASTSHPPSKEEITLRVAVANVNYGNSKFHLLPEWLLKERPDIAIVLEMTPEWRAALDRLHDTFPWQYWTPGNRYGDGIGVFSRIPVDQRAVLNPGRGIKLAVYARLLLKDGTRCRLLAVHPIAPTTREKTRQRDAYLAEASQWVRRFPDPVIVAGDLNAAPWSYAFRQFAETGGLSGARLSPSWPAFAGPLGIPIDQVLGANGVLINDGRTGSRIGSDHFPVLSRVSIPAHAVISKSR